MRTLLALLCLVGFPLLAQDRISLDGSWDLATEPRDAARSYPKTAEVPGTFETELGISFDGVACYRHALPLQPEWRGAAVRIEFAAVATHATVFCNGKEVAQHLGGWTPFRATLTDALQWDGKDVVEVRCDERVGHNTQGFLPIIEPHFGGIWQSVTLCIDRDAVLDRNAFFAFGHADGSLQVSLAVLGHASNQALSALVEVLDGSMPVGQVTLVIVDGIGKGTLQIHNHRLWSPKSPALYGVRCRLLTADSRELDSLDRRVGFRTLQADGTTIKWNGAPLSVRGILHWGFSPPDLAPLSNAPRWRREIEYFRSLGFNTLKCCLFVPPPCVYDLCDELGMIVWQEYPTWHPQIDAAHRDELLREYREFFALDAGHPAVAFRSLTCETGQSAELQVIQDLFDACHAAVPNTLVVDDSSWIGWQRVTDFWDEHPYGNNRWWPVRLAEFKHYVAAHGEKPLLLGECIAADTWADRSAWDQINGKEPRFWQPLCQTDQVRFENWISDQFGSAQLATLAPIARDYAMRTRRYQIERLRMQIPDAGYVVSVARDFPKARMGLIDDLGRPKWDAAAWQWQGDDMLCLDTMDDARAFVVGQTGQPIHARLVRGATKPSEQHCLTRLLPVTSPTPVSVQGKIDGVQASFDVWALPLFEDVRPNGVQVVDRLDAATLDALENGARIYLHVDGQPFAPLSESKWYLTGAPFAPPHPVHERLPARMLIELQPFDLDGGRVMPYGAWLDQVDPILAFWETHDLPDVRAHLFAFDTNYGAGRLLVSCLDRKTPAGRYVEHQLLLHLRDGKAPGRSLSATTQKELRSLLDEQRINLPIWRFRTDPKDEGLAGSWQLPSTDTAPLPWREMRAGAHWENQASDLQQFTGIAWYQLVIVVPESFRNQPARLVFEGIDDSATVWLDGEAIAQFGDAKTETSVWLQASVAELGLRLEPGPHTLALRVVDHQGSGGLWRAAYLTTGPAAGNRLLQR
ncbi:MAG: hypothetical protein EXS02_03710 [Planctomycetes bacterium]|nr:hypothetical protein [Planctomycetota bacterium]